MSGCARTNCGACKTFDDSQHLGCGSGGCAGNIWYWKPFPAVRQSGCLQNVEAKCLALTLDLILALPVKGLQLIKADAQRSACLPDLAAHAWSSSCWQKSNSELGSLAVRRAILGPRLGCGVCPNEILRLVHSCARDTSMLSRAQPRPVWQQLWTMATGSMLGRQPSDCMHLCFCSGLDSFNTAKSAPLRWLFRRQEDTS